jgi:hypothetical protein
MKRPRTRNILIVAGAAVVLLAGGTAAGAAIAGPVDGSGNINGCYTTKRASSLGGCSNTTVG